ncbi:PrgI family protein [Actinoplanes couchii]|uniref:PrgI family protein n=1 Tax=Actinoplanes couchii TaxID=403638 RepID=A0ABQ3XRK4_9ACTN|nr:PrgI family protein [Actinoplanes couchii]MDR6318909.1 hypothetical protein [Actinoplanes couchii]GID61152.1 hypothetical protein Aco03nite_095560 [Actinoplanes couchii]
MDDDVSRVKVPADVGAPDTIAWGLTFRQLAILGTIGAGGWLVYGRFGPLLPPIVWLVAALPVTAVTVLVVLGRRDGLPLDVWLRHGLSMAAGARRQVPGTPAGQQLLAVAGPAVPGVLRSPATVIAVDGTVSVDGAARQVIACGTTDIALRTGTEQQALLDGFGAWLNALTGPAQIVVSAARHDLSGYAEAARDQAEGLPDAALRAAAAEYAGFLLDLNGEREPLRRQVLTVVGAGPGGEATVRAFTGLGVSAQPLDGGAVTAALAAAADPFDAPVPGRRAVPDVPIAVRGEAR